MCLLAASLGAGELQPIGRHVVSGTSGQGRFTFGGAPSCDASGNLLVELPVGGSIERGPLMRISANGRDVVRLEPNSVSGFASAGQVACALGRSGQAYVLVALGRKGKQSEQSIIAFDSKGRSSKPVQLADIWGKSLAVFDSGRFLIAGRSERGGAGLYVAGADGQLIRQVALVKEPAESSAASVDGGEPEDAGPPLSDSTFAEPTSDDHVIVVRRTTHGPVYRVSSSGEVVQKFDLVPPTGVTNIIAIKVSGSRLAVAYRTNRDEKGREEWVLTTYDLTTEVRIAEYTTNHLGVFSCYTSDGSSDTFGFLRPEDDGLVIVRATER